MLKKAQLEVQEDGQDSEVNCKAKASADLS